MYDFMIAIIICLLVFLFGCVLGTSEWFNRIVKKILGQ